MRLPGGEEREEREKRVIETESERRKKERVREREMRERKKILVMRKHEKKHCLAFCTLNVSSCCVDEQIGSREDLEVSFDGEGREEGRRIVEAECPFDGELKVEDA